ncbi:MAG: hypothetical protein J1G01_06450 [Clostridiales bacterium]|nr:hypothetical protein [Clostridiales bacterium]
MAQKRNRKRKNGNNIGNHDALGMTLVVISVFLLLCIVVKPILGVFSEAIFSVLLGVFGIASYPMLLATLLLGIFLLIKRSISASPKTIVGIAFLIFFALIILQLASTHQFLRYGFATYIDKVYAAKYSVGGVLMGTIAFGLKSVITEVASYIVCSVAFVITLLLVTSAFDRLRAYISEKRAGGREKAPQEQEREEYSIYGDEAQRVITASPRAGLFVGTIERSTPDFGIEKGVVTDLPVTEKRAVSDYAQSPVIEKERDDDAKTRTAAHYKLYSDSEEINKKSAAEFSKVNREGSEVEYRSDKSATRNYGEEIAEPFVRVNNDAFSADKPKRLDYDGTPNNLQALYFPPEKDIQFNDEGIETAQDKRADSYERARRDFENTEERRNQRMGFAPSFDMPRKDVRPEPVEIIDASAPIHTNISAFEPAPPVEDRFMKAVEEERRTPPLETDRFKSEDIIDAFEVRGRYTPVQDEDNSLFEDDREDILDGSNPSPVPSQSRVFGRPDPAESSVLSDDILDGSLIISNAPAIDMSETHDNVSDIINGDDLSGMYISADEIAAPVTKPTKRQKSNAPLENQLTIDTMLKEKAEESVVATQVRKYKKYNYAPPPIDLLKIYEKVDSSDDELNNNAQILEDVVSRFLKSQVKVINIIPGPQVTQYELDVPSGTSVKSIESRSADIAYELAAVSGVRVEAPIPGKRAVGIEVPNKTKSIVGLREIVDSSTFTKPKSPLVFSVGKDIGGGLIVCDLEKVPHLLIAGQTGSGKSAGLNSLIVSLLYKSSPEDLRFILIDPKRVEFSKFRGMPHLLFEKTITEPNEALNALKWAANEMDRRYTIMQKYACSKLSEYNNQPEVLSGKINKLPHIVIIIDELANLMQSAVSGEIESKISSIAALARAAGIHLIVATQRPSADVITGTIKANLTSRIAFKVPDATNSRIIIDEVGAETLAGDGDMLFYPQDYYAAKRVQGSFVGGEEVLAVVNYLKEHYECDFDEEAEKFVCGGGGGGGDSMGGGGDDGSNSLDPLAARIMAHAIKSKQISTSVIQRRFSIGYARAARIIDSMEDNGYIGPSTGNSRPRDVIMTPEQYSEVFGHDLDDA